MLTPQGLGLPLMYCLTDIFPWTALFAHRYTHFLLSVNCYIFLIWSFKGRTFINLSALLRGISKLLIMCKWFRSCKKRSRDMEFEISGSYFKFFFPVHTIRTIGNFKHPIIKWIAINIWISCLFVGLKFVKPCCTVYKFVLKARVETKRRQDGHR